VTVATLPPKAEIVPVASREDREGDKGLSGTGVMRVVAPAALVVVSTGGEAWDWDWDWACALRARLRSRARRVEACMVCVG